MKFNINILGAMIGFLYGAFVGILFWSISLLFYCLIFGPVDLMFDTKFICTIFLNDFFIKKTLGVFMFSGLIIGFFVGLLREK